MAQYGFYFNGQRCTGCKTCVLACKDYNDLTPDVSLRTVFEYAGGSWEQRPDGTWGNDVYAYFVSVACNHCDEPACLTVCPQSAISKDPDTGLVTRDRDLCVGCGACAMTCPYGAPKVDVTASKSVKCDGCAARLAQGEAPVCVESCPLRALEFGPVDELRAAHGEGADVAPLPDSSLTQPNLVVGDPRHAVAGDDATGAVANLREVA